MLSSSLVQISRSNLLTITGRFIGALVLAFAMSLIAVVSPSSSVSAKTGKVWRALSHRIESQSFVVYQNELGAAVCRKATEVEHQQITERSGGATELILVRDTRREYPVGHIVPDHAVTHPLLILLVEIPENNGTHRLNRLAPIRRQRRTSATAASA